MLTRGRCILLQLLICVFISCTTWVQKKKVKLLFKKKTPQSQNNTKPDLVFGVGGGENTERESHHLTKQKQLHDNTHSENKLYNGTRPEFLLNPWIFFFFNKPLPSLFFSLHILIKRHLVNMKHYRCLHRHLFSLRCIRMILCRSYLFIKNKILVANCLINRSYLKSQFPYKSSAKHDSGRISMTK